MYTDPFKKYFARKSKKPWAECGRSRSHNQGFMHKNCKLTPVNRKEIFNLWKDGLPITKLSRCFRVRRKVIYKIIERAKNRDFSVHKSINIRFKNIKYGLKHLSKSEEKAIKRKNNRVKRYEKEYPGEMLHLDTKKIRRTRKCNRKWPSECLYIAIDDCSRQLFAGFFPARDQLCSAKFLKKVLRFAPYPVESVLTDNGSEFKGGENHAFSLVCKDNAIKQKFTRPKRPQTNGKAERVIRTILQECIKENKFEDRKERKKYLSNFVRYYNKQRPHSALIKRHKVYTPCQAVEKLA